MELLNSFTKFIILLTYKIFIMKKIILLGALLVSSFSIAEFNNSTNLLVKINKEKFVESKSTPDACFVRECTITTTVGPDGNTYTEKTCSPWVQVLCPNTEEESAPGIY